MPELPSLLHTLVMVVLEVVAGRFEAIVEALALNLPELLRRHIPTTAVLGWSVLGHRHGRSPHSFAEVRESRFVASAEAFAVLVASGWGNRGVPELPSLFHSLVMVVLEVVAGRFEAIVEALALNLPELLGRRIPTTAVLAISLLRAVLGWSVLGHEQGGRSECKSERC
jgi:hypothetical protein